MGTGDRPLVSILMAVYEPRLDWLREQLDSLNAQTYPNLRLYVRDDCSQTLPFEEIERLVRECITAFPYSIARNEKNLGSNKTFERLTTEAEGEYFAYCDQDDVWLPGKTARLQETMEREDAQVVCSDMYVINANGTRMAESITRVNKRQRFYSGEGLKTLLLHTNFVTGTAMLIRAGTAREAIPFSPYTIHDSYLAIFAARKGKIVSLPDRLLRYRIHGGNQSRPFPGVKNKESYYVQRIVKRQQELMWLRDRFAEDGDMCEEIDGQLRWLDARDRWFQGELKAAPSVWRGRKYGPLTVAFELVLDHLPECIMMAVVRLRRGTAI